MKTRWQRRDLSQSLLESKHKTGLVKPQTRSIFGQIFYHLNEISRVSLGFSLVELIE